MTASRRITPRCVNQLAISVWLIGVAISAWAAPAPIGTPGTSASYTLDSDAKDSNVVEFTISLGAIEQIADASHQWLHLDAAKKNKERLRIWALCRAYPGENLNTDRDRLARYVLQQDDDISLEFRHAISKEAVLPGSGAWQYLFPRAIEPANILDTDGLFPEQVQYLGLKYRRIGLAQDTAIEFSEESRVIELRPDQLVGVPHSTRQVDETRRFDGTDYDYIALTEDDFATMIAASINCFYADAKSASFFDTADVFHWGTKAASMPYPECLYDPRYIGPVLFLDEPAVVTRDRAIRPALLEDPTFREGITPQAALAELEKYYQQMIADGPPNYFMKQLADRTDVNLGNMHFLQANIYSWETMVSSAAYQLGHEAATPGAIVFEPPGQVGARRLLPGMNITYGCEIPITATNHFIDIIIGYLRGAARSSGKEWGISIYGSVDRADAPAFMRRAYDLGATRFFYWDMSQHNCVPFGEVLDLSERLNTHAQQSPPRDLDALLHAASVAILLPPGYNLGHVHMGRGLLWGVPELNLERQNVEGVPYRTVMRNFFTEIERCLRSGTAFDLMWDLTGLNLDGYREVIRIREDGKLEIMEGGTSTVLNAARIPDRPVGNGPRISLTLPEFEGKVPFSFQASAHVVEGDSPIYFSYKPDKNGINHNQQVAWELYGPNDEDFTYRVPTIVRGDIIPHDDGGHVVEATIHIEKTGAYRLRAATTDVEGRSAVVWKEIVAAD